MLIDEMEALWAPIAESDDWSEFHRVLGEIDEMRDAYGSDDRRLDGEIFGAPGHQLVEAREPPLDWHADDAAGASRRLPSPPVRIQRR